MKWSRAYSLVMKWRAGMNAEPLAVQQAFYEELIDFFRSFHGGPGTRPQSRGEIAEPHAQATDTSIATCWGEFASGPTP